MEIGSTSATGRAFRWRGWTMLALVVAGALRLAVAAEAAPGRTTLLDLGWLAGDWRGEKGDVRLEEYWTAPAGGMMIGLHRDVPPEGPAFFEFLRIVEDEEGIAYLAMPAGRHPPTRFPLKSAGRRNVVFENPAHDYPQRILYRLAEEDVLHARIEGLDGGEERSSEWLFRR